MTASNETSSRHADSDARQRIRSDLGASFFVEAAAGTGKTTAVIDRIVSVLEAGLGELKNIAAVTFTEKAAGEMKLRLREKIENRRQEITSSNQRQRLRAALQQLEVAHISTIHGFCGDLLREHPVESGVDPLFQIMPQDEAQRLAGAAFDQWFERALAAPPEGVARILRRRPAKSSDKSSSQLLREASWNLINHRDYAAGWTRKSIDRKIEIDQAIEQLSEIAAWAAVAQKPNSYLAKGFSKIQHFIQELAAREKIHDRDYDALEFQIAQVSVGREYGWEYKGHGEYYGPDLLLADVIARRDEIHAELTRLTERWGADLAACLREELRSVVESYEELKHQEGRLDFLDLLIRVRDLLIKNDQLRARLQSRFTHIFIDEFQDTDPLQAEILLLLAADDPKEREFLNVAPSVGKLFIVGDPKQSIYRFRRADVILYERIKRQLAGRGVEVLQLTTSFRSTPEIQAFVNGAFDLRMTGSEDGSQASYVPLDRFRPDWDEQPAVIALPAPHIYGSWGSVTKTAVSRSLPDAIAAFVEWLVTESGWTVTEKDQPETPLPIEHRHVCLLARRFQSAWEDPIRPYISALEERQIPHVLVGGRSYHQREEVQAARACLTAIEWPDDEVSIYAALRGPFLALNDDVLLAFRGSMGSLHPLAPRDNDQLDALSPEVAAVDDGLAILKELHLRRNRQPIAQTVHELLAACRAHAGVAFWPAGEQALANVLRLIERARDFERGGAPSFRAFVERLADEEEREATDEAPIVEEGTEGVRIMTVHKAKGLEFPVVMLIDPTPNATFQMPGTHVDRSRGLWAERVCEQTPWEILENRDLEAKWEKAEADRLVYVGATRARDLLVVPTVGDHDGGDRGWWLDALNPAVYPVDAARRDPQLAPGCPPFGDDPVVDRPTSSKTPNKEAGVAPGLHTAATGNSVVWWDPNVLALDRAGGLGLRQQLLLEEAESNTGEENKKAYEAWEQRRADVLERGALPSIRVESVTTAAGRGQGDETADTEEPLVKTIHVASSNRTHNRGRRFGTLVHAVLARIDLQAGHATLQPFAESEGRVLGAPSAEIAEAVEAIRRALEQPVMKRAVQCDAAGQLRRETPVYHVQPDGELLEGVVDLAFRGIDNDNPTWTIVDFKTSREIETMRSTAEEQVRIYARAIEAATGEQATGVVLVL